MAETNEKELKDGQSSETAQTVQSPRKGNGKRYLRILVALLVLLVIATAVYAYWYYNMKDIVFTDDARLNGFMLDLAPEIPGRALEVRYSEGDFVHRGDIVVLLEKTTIEATLAQAESSLKTAQANVPLYEAKLARSLNGNRPEEVNVAESNLKRLQGEENLARLEFERIRQLTEDGATPQARLDRARTAWESAKQNRGNAEQALTLLQQGSRQEDIEAARAELAVAKSRVAEAAAAVDKVKKDLDRCVVIAPFDGYVVRRWQDPGAMLQAGQPVVSIFDPSSLRVDANIEEKFLNQIRIGDLASIDVDAYPDMHLTGHVVEILRATNSQFSLVPSEGVSGTFIKVSQRVPLRIVLSGSLPDQLLAPGLSVEVKLHVGTDSESGSQS